MLDRVKADKKYYAALFLVILIQCIYITVIFATQKQGYHSDELWNYGFANSTDGAHIYKEDVGLTSKNVNEWVSSETLKDYISVGTDEIFSYATVYHNAEHDYNPPLGYMLLHFLCSFFPGTWSKWYCFILNIICFIITQIYLSALVSGITGRKEAGILASLFYGFTMGSVNISIFLRIYAPAVMFGVMLIYYAGEFYNKRKEQKRNAALLIKMFIVTLAGCLTVHLFLPFAFIITAMYCLYYLFTKRFKYMLKYGFTMAASVAASFAIFPLTVYNVFLGSDTYSYMTKRFNPKMQFKIYMSYITNDLFGIHTSRWETMTMTYIAYALLIIIFFAVPVCFLLRNNERFRESVRRFRDSVIIFAKKIKNFPYTLLVLVVTIAFMIVIASYRTSVYAMGRYCTRYLFMIYPLLAAVAVVIVYTLLYWIFKNIKIRNIIGVVLCLFVAGLSMILGNKSYYFRHYENGQTLDMLESNANCIVVLEDTWVMTALTCELYNTQNYFLTSYVGAMKADYNGVTASSDPLYLILDVSDMDGNGRLLDILGATVVDDREYTREFFSSDYEEFFKGLDISTKCEHTGTDAAFGRQLEIYRLN